MQIPKSIINTDDFFEFFEKEEVININTSITSINRKNVNFAILKNKSNNFNLEDFVEYLDEISVTYALPSDRIEELKSNNKYKTLAKESSSKFISYDRANNGEGGELILYSFLENHLDAPKLLSKMKLKTNKEMPVYGGDGVHIKKLNEKSFELIYCESKMYKDLESALTEAFNSVNGILINDTKRDFENTVITTNLNGEFSDDLVEELSKKILPSKEGNNTNFAISIFIGFEFNTKSYDKSQEYNEYSMEIASAIETEIKRRKRKINNFFEKHQNITFYIYLLPFEDIEDARKKIIGKIKGEI